MPLSNQVKNQHLMWRAGFGPHAGELHYLQQAATDNVYRQLVQQASVLPDSIDVADEKLKSLISGAESPRRLSEEERRAVRRQNREDIKSLNLSWLNEMVNTQSQLREKMAFFWHGHFACRTQNIFFQQALLDVIRKDALGNFGDLLRGVSKSAAMLNFLNNNQNRKGHPNENFAREVMELFTIGRGNYSENDVKEAARAFTGWGANQRGEFIFRKQVHDTGVKTVFGKQGNFDGDQVINMLLERKETARFVTTRVWRFFVSEKEDAQKISFLAERFYKSGYKLQTLMDDIFLSDWFYHPAYIGTKIKSPVELLVGLRRMLPMQFDQEEVQLLIQRILGQQLFYPPNVAGWPGGANWIDTSSLMFRLNIPHLIKDSGAVELKPKDDDDEMMGIREARKLTGARGRQQGFQVSVKVNWDSYITHISKQTGNKIADVIAGIILQTPGKINPKLFSPYVDVSQKEAFIKSFTIQLMSTPEYQLC
jgi:uncharacterized protein (DUF1800 family)